MLDDSTRIHEILIHAFLADTWNGIYMVFITVTNAWTYEPDFSDSSSMMPYQGQAYNLQ